MLLGFSRENGGREKEQKKGDYVAGFQQIEKSGGIYILGFNRENGRKKKKGVISLNPPELSRLLQTPPKLQKLSL
jgi:hypothetical protein